PPPTRSTPAASSPGTTPCSSRSPPGSLKALDRPAQPAASLVPRSELQAAARNAFDRVRAGPDRHVDELDGRPALTVGHRHDPPAPVERQQEGPPFGEGSQQPIAAGAQQEREPR